MSSGEAGRTSISLFGIHVTARVVGFLGLIYFTRVLSQAELGVYFLFFLLVQIASMVSNLGLGQALVQRVSEGTRSSEVFSAALGVVLAVSLLVTALAYGLRGQIASYVGADVPALLSLSVALWLLADVLIRTVQGEDRVLTSGLLQLLQDIVRVGVGAVLITVGYGPVGLMYGVVAGFLVTVGAGYAVTNLSVTIPAPEDVSHLFAISRYTMFFGPTNFVYFWLDTFVIGLVLGRAPVSSYEVAWQTTRVLIIATTAITQTIFPKVSRWASEDRFEEIERVLPGAIIFSVFFPLPGVVGLAVLGGSVLSLVYQPAYSEAALPMAILAGYMVIESLQRVANSTLTGLDRADVPFRARLVGVALAIVLNVVLIPVYGLLGAAVATFVSKLVDTAIQWVLLNRLLDVRLPGRSLTWESASALLMGGVVFAAAAVVQPASLPALFALVGVGAAVYGVAVLFDPDIRQVVEQYLPVRLPAT